MINKADDVIHALAYISADDRELWLKMGMAIKSGFGEAGYQIWDEWSQNGSTYSQKDTQTTWRSIDISGGITVGTLFHIAKEHGYLPKGSVKLSHPRNLTPNSIKQDSGSDRAIKADAAAKQANVIWSSAQSGIEHAYVKSKGITSLGSRFQYAEHTDCHLIFWAKDSEGNIVALKGLLLLLPLYNIDGKIRGLQAIDEQGLKSLQKGIAKSGLFMPLFNGQKIPPDYAGELFLTEGFATAATMKAATGKPTIMAIDAGNLKHVAKAWRDRCKNAKIIIGGDVDKTGTGQAAALKAAELCKGQAIFPYHTSTNITDFNDMETLCGLDQVKAIIDSSCASINIVTPIQNSVNKSPLPLPDSLPSVLPFNPEMLPEAIRGFVMDVADRQQSPPDFVAVAAICALSAVLGRKVLMHPKQNDDWKITPNQWGAIIGRPSAMKSPSMKAALEPLNQLEIKYGKQYTNDKIAFESDAEFANVARTVARRAAKKLLEDNKLGEAKSRMVVNSIEPPPTRHRLIVNDATVEKLGELLKENPNGLILVRDELSGWLSKLAKEEFHGDRAFYLECFDGNGRYVSDRIIRGTTETPNCTLSVMGGIQPNRIAPLVRNAMSGVVDDGLVQRLQLVVWPDEIGTWEWNDRAPDPISLAKYNNVFTQLDQLNLGGDDNPPFFKFSVDAQEMFIEWSNELHMNARAEDMHPAIESHLIKMQKTIPGLALLFELIDGGRENVGVIALARALDWSDYLKSHAVRLYSLGLNIGIEGAHIILQRKCKLQTPFKARDIKQKGWTNLGTMTLIKEALECLIDHNYLRSKQTNITSTGGRPTMEYSWID